MARASAEILGMNARNLAYIRPNNRRTATRLADNKLATKRLLRRFGIPTPKLLAIIGSQQALEEFVWNTLPDNFVIKPNSGLGGEGIIVMRGRVKSKAEQSDGKLAWVSSDGREWNVDTLKLHAANILSGNFSIAGTSDLALIEQRIERDPAFRELSPMGVPDIRVIVFNKVPVMAMLRLPTERSHGKANLALGAVGVGLDMATGRAVHATLKKPRRKSIEQHPDTGASLLDVQVPYWDEVLAMSVEAQIASRLGYLGVDLAIDKNYGPVIVELNARPGLEIQTINAAPLRARLRRLYGMKVRTVRKGVTVAKEIFGGEVEAAEGDGRPTLGIVEPIELSTRDKQKREKLLAKIDTGATFTSVDRDLAVRLGYKGVLEAFQEYGLEETMTRAQALKQYRRFRRDVLARFSEDIVDTKIIHSSHGTTYRVLIPVTFTLGGREVVSKATVMVRKHLRYPVIIGQRDLKHFMVDPSRRRDQLKSFVRR